jgi:predicted DNA-binding transcriptional regulator YafY
MNRVERLTGLLLLLQERSKRGPVRAAELADYYEVSRRTILRDMDALCEMGVPVMSQDGPGGGFSLSRGYALTPLPLTIPESVLMLLALDALDRLADAPFAAARETLRAKLKTLIATRHASDVAGTLDAVSFDVPSRTAKSPYLDLLIDSARSGRWLQITYRSAERTSAQRILPLHVSTSGGFWYVRAYSADRAEERTYRVDRVMSAGPILPPHGVVLSPAADYHHESNPEVHIRLTPQGVERVEHEPHLGAAICRNPDGSGVLRQRVPPSELRWFAEYVVSLGSHAEALAPPELRRRAHELAGDIAARHEKESAAPPSR